MRRNNLFAKFIIILTLVALLTVPVGRVTGVSALADPAPIPELAPVFDTQIYQLKDYFDENIEGTPHEPIFYLILGCYLVLQAGMGDYQIVDPYTTSDGVAGWLKSTGIQLWNSLNSFVSFDPVTGTDLRPTLAPLIAYALGATQLAYKYNSEQDFLDDVQNSDNFFLPFSPDLQLGINAVLAQNGGLYNWQYTTGPWVTHGFVYNDVSLSDQQAITYVQLLDTLPAPYVRFNQTAGARRFRAGDDRFSRYHSLFIDTTNNKLYLIDDENNINSSSSWAVSAVNVYNDNVRLTTGVNLTRVSNLSFNPSQWVDLVQLAQAYFDNFFSEAGKEICFDEFVDTVYYGSLVQNKILLENSTNLNFAELYLPYFQQVQNDYLFDIKGLLTDLLNITNLYPVMLDHLFDTNGVQVVDLPTIQVNINLPDTNPLPVNLNDIQYYTENEYLDVVKERVNAFSDTVGSFVAFWHNTDYEIVYAVFGSALIVLLGAFIGKWGHS